MNKNKNQSLLLNNEEELRVTHSQIISTLLFFEEDKDRIINLKQELSNNISKTDVELSTKIIKSDNPKENNLSYSEKLKKISSPYISNPYINNYLKNKNNKVNKDISLER